MANILAGTADATRRNAALQIAIDRMQDMVDDKKQFLATNNALLDKKNHLLDEVNSLSRDLQHRFRNHLQLIYAMLNDQRRATADAAAAKGINEIARRIMALAQIYESLIGTGLSNAIDFGAYYHHSVYVSRTRRRTSALTSSSRAIADNWFSAWTL